jgi:hypothetical protein
MREPTDWDRREQELRPFVLAAKTASLARACDLLFINGSELVWSENNSSLYLAHVPTDPRFDEALQVTRARFDLSMLSLVGAAAPLLVQMGQAAAKRDRASGEDLFSASNKELIGYVVDGLQSGRLFKHLGALPIDYQALVTDTLTGFFAPGAVALKQRLISSTGMSDSLYEEMLRCLVRLGGPVESVFRVSFPAGLAEIGLGGRARLRRMKPPKGPTTLELFRLAPKFADLKRGQDRALCLFVSEYLNSQVTVGRHAFPCAEYGGKGTGDIDIHIPKLKLGIEVKLNQAPTTVGSTKVPGIANDLKKSLETYVRCKCQRIYYISNLTTEMAEAVVAKAFGSNAAGAVTIVTGGLVGLLKALDRIKSELDDVVALEFKQAMMGGAEPVAALNTESAATAAVDLPAGSGGLTRGNGLTRGGRGHGRDAPGAGNGVALPLPPGTKEGSPKRASRVSDKVKSKAGRRSKG